MLRGTAEAGVLEPRDLEPLHGTVREDGGEGADGLRGPAEQRLPKPLTGRENGNTVYIYIYK